MKISYVSPRVAANSTPSTVSVDAVGVSPDDVTALSQASATLTVGNRIDPGTVIRYRNVASRSGPIPGDESVPTSQPRRVAGASRQRRCWR
jgi:hypothetical protein